MPDSIRPTFYSNIPPDTDPASPEHNYRKLFTKYLLPQFQKPGLHHVEIAHDGICGIYYGQTCNCHPTITVSDTTSGRVVFRLVYRKPREYQNQKNF